MGAIGVMQLMPPTGATMIVGDVHEIELHIHAGVKCMRIVQDTYSTNCGSTRIQDLRKEAPKRGSSRRR